MKIKVKLNEKSIQEALTHLNKMKEQLPLMKKELYERCCLQIQELATYNISNIDIGSDVFSQITSNWHILSTENGAILWNNSDKSVYVEFGTGIVGEQSPHPNANITNPAYEYNIPTRHKRAGKYHDENTWRFYKNDLDEVDLQYGYYETWYTDSDTIKIITRGSPATLFVFNAIEQFKNQNYAKRIWEEIKRKYWG